MITVIGLGNPGVQYKDTRHNAGYSVLCRVVAFFHEELKKRPFCNYSMAKTDKATLVFPQTFMNKSGEVLKNFKIYKGEDLVVICDNMDLALGGVRVKFGGGNAGQKGLKNISELFGSPDFVRVYVGIGRPAPGVDVSSHVLGRERDEERLKAYNEALDMAAKAVISYIDGKSIEEIQCEYNRKGLL